MKPLLFLLCLPLSAGGIPYDKQCHAAMGAVAYVAGYHFAKACGSEHPKLWGLATSLAVGIAKESWDKHHPPHTCEAGDVVAAVSGGLVVSFVWRF